MIDGRSAYSEPSNYVVGEEENNERGPTRASRAFCICQIENRSTVLSSSLQQAVAPDGEAADEAESEAAVRAPSESQLYIFETPERNRVLKLRRGYLSRRLWREFLERTYRVGLLVLGDVLISAAAVAAWTVTGGGGFIAGDAEALPFVALFLCSGQAILGTYGEDVATRAFGRVALGTFYGVAGLFVVGLLYSTFALPWPAYLAIFSMGASGGFLWRSAYEGLLQTAQRWGLGRRRVLIVASDTQAKRIRDRFERMEDPSVRIVARVTPDEVGRTDPSGQGRVLKLLRRGDVDTVILGSELRPAEFHHLVRECLGHGITLSVVPGSLTAYPLRSNGRRVQGWPEIRIRPPAHFVAQIALKRCIDILGAVVGLVLLSPLFLVVAAAIRLESPGPVFFRQKRPGLGGVPFSLVKFRTMRADAEEVLRRNPALYEKFLANDCKLPEGEDPRISRVGRFLRKSSLDELPQLINVLKGEMSLVGPRPVVGPELLHYGENTETFLSVKPGLTGYWQISGRSEVAYPERAVLDLRYIERWSLLFDLRILMATVPYVLTRRGAH